MNESFKGPDSLNAYKTALDKYLKELAAHKFNDTTAPQLILVSPIAHENIGGNYPDPTEHNKNLELYTTAMKEVADANKIGFIDLYNPSLKSTPILQRRGGAECNKPETQRLQTPVPGWGLGETTSYPSGLLTINGIHLNDKGYDNAAKWMCDALGLNYKTGNLSVVKKTGRDLRTSISFINGEP